MTLESDLLLTLYTLLQSDSNFNLPAQENSPIATEHRTAVAIIIKAFILDTIIRQFH